MRHCARTNLGPGIRMDNEWWQLIWKNVRWNMQRAGMLWCPCIQLKLGSARAQTAKTVTDPGNTQWPIMAWTTPRRIGIKFGAGGPSIPTQTSESRLAANPGRPWLTTGPWLGCEENFEFGGRRRRELERSRQLVFLPVVPARSHPTNRMLL